MTQTTLVTADVGLATQTEQTSFFSRAYEGFKSIASKIGAVVLIILQVLASAFCFIVNPGIFLLSFTVGVLLPDSTDMAVNKVINFIKNHPIIFAVGVIVAGFWALPVTLAITTSLLGLRAGSTLNL